MKELNEDLDKLIEELKKVGTMPDDNAYDHRIIAQALIRILEYNTV